MKNYQKTTRSTGSLTSLIFLVFLVLKLAGIGEVATWSWWWVTSPLWIPIALVLSIFIISIIITGIISLFSLLK